MIHIILQGRVQGVGCRWLCKMLADKLNIAGTVSNLDNGDVEIYAQGSQESLDIFVSEIKKGLSPVMRVNSMTISEVDTDKKLNNFVII